MVTTVAQSPALVQYDAALHTLAAQATTRYAGEHLRIAKGLVIALNHGATLQADGTALVQSQSEPEIVYTVNGHCDCQDATHGATEGRCKHRWAKTLTSRALALAATPVETLSTLSEELYGPQAAATAAQRTACGQPAAAKESPMLTATTDPDEDDATLQAAQEWDAQHAATHQPPAAPAPAPRGCPEAAFSLTLHGTLDGQDAMLTVRGQTAEEFTANLAVVRGLFDRPTAPPPSQPAAQPPAEPTTRACPVHAGVLMVEQHNARGAWWSHRQGDGWCKGK